jgi:hypothetical protein
VIDFASHEIATASRQAVCPQMSDTDSNKEPAGEVETVLLDVELFLKYRAIDRAVQRLRDSIERHPRSLLLRERLREVCASGKIPDEAARQCLALASLYIEREELDTAQDRLLEAKQLDPRINIASGLEAVRRARKPNGPFSDTSLSVSPGSHVLAGDLGAISIFDVVQVLENTKLTGTLAISLRSASLAVLFNDGRVVGAQAEAKMGEEAFRVIVGLTNGTFQFERSARAFPVTILATSNTNLILDSLRHLDEQKR